MSIDSRPHATAHLRALFWFAIGTSTLNAAYAALSARGLVYDGAFYLLTIAAHRNFHLIEPARVSVQAMQQLPAVLGARMGIRDLWTLGRLFSLGMSGWPVVLTALCWFALPRNEKSWIVGPLLNLALAIPPASFIGISEGIIASCLLWLALFLVSFHLTQPFGALAALAASIACAVAHEAAVLCLLLIGWQAAAQFARLRGFPRLACALVVIVSAVGAVYMARWIVAPRSAIERSDFLLSLFGGFLGSPRTPNLPAFASLLAACFGAIALRTGRRAAVAAIAGSAVVLGCGILFAAMPDALASPGRFFAARGLPIMVTTILSASFVFLRRRAKTAPKFVTPAVIGISLALISSQALMQAVATNLWGDYVHDLRALVAARAGIIAHDEAMAALEGEGSRFRRELLRTWSVQPLSVLLAPGGQVKSFMQPAASERWVPYDLRNPRTLPRMPQLDWSHFPTRPDS